MDDTLQAELTEALKTAGFLDASALALNAFDKIREGVKTSGDVPRAVAEMRRAKPTLFKLWEDDANFDKREQQMRDSFSAPAANADDVRDLIKSIDPARLGHRDFATYEATVAHLARRDFSSIDTGRLAEIAAQQKGVAA